MIRLLIVHPNPSIRSMVSSMLQTMGYRIDEAETDRSAARMLESSPTQVVLVGYERELSEVTELLGLIRRKYPQSAIVVFGRSPRPDTIRDATQRGAVACIPFPVAANQLRAAVVQAASTATPSRGSMLPSGPMNQTRFDASGGPAGQPWAETNRLPNPTDTGLNMTYGEQLNLGPRVSAPTSYDTPEPMFLGNDPNIGQVLELVNALGSMRSTVLLQGEAGTGKRLLARILHRRSSGTDSAFLYYDCQTSITGSFELDLFGRVVNDHYEPGMIAKAAGGTLLIDNVSSLDAQQQNLLLRAIRDGDYQVQGMDRPLRVECRLVIGTSQELGPLVERGQFRPDLFYALSSVTLKLPPLRHRGQDILRLAEHFLQQAARQRKQTILGISPDACRRLTSHDWPQNVAELKRIMEQAVTRCRGHWIELSHIDFGTPPVSYGSASPAAVKQVILPLKEALEEPEKRLILEALRALNWNRQETARVLDINRTTLYKKMKKYGLIFEEPVWSN